MTSTTQGAAVKGSRRCLQEWVEHRGSDLADHVVTASPGLTAFRPVIFDWKSPRPDEKYREYRDDFGDALGLNQAQNVQIRGFWPAQGPQWDGLAVLTSAAGHKGYVLVEAKAHPGETTSTMGACAPQSVSTIKTALDQVKAHMGASGGVNWTASAYQLANRLAFLYFMQERLGLPTWLALINFVDDASYKPTELGQWRAHYETLFARLGLTSSAPLLDRVILVFPPGSIERGGIGSARE